MTSSSQTLSHISSLNTSDVKAPPPSVFPLLSSLSHTQALRPKQVGGRGPEIAPIAWGKPEVGRALVSETLKLENPTFFFPAAQLFSNYLMQCWINAERTQLFQQQHHDLFEEEPIMQSLAVPGTWLIASDEQLRASSLGSMNPFSNFSA